MSDAEIDVEMPQEEIPEEEEVFDAPDEDVPAETEEPLPDVNLEVKEIVPDGDVFLNAKEQAPPKKPRAKKPPSEKQLAHLAKIRVKALEAKKAKQAQKKAQQDKGPKNKISSYQPGKEVNFQEEEEHIDVSNMGGLVHLTQDQLRQLQYEAIYGYDTMRKNRKQKKKADEAQEQAEKKAYASIAKAVQPHDNDGWGVCFQ